MAVDDRPHAPGPGVTQTASELLAAAGVGIIAIDDTGVIRSANIAAQDLLSTGDSQLVGTPARELSGASTEDGRVAFDHAIRSGQLLHIDDDTFRRSDGSLLPVWWAITPLRNANAVLVGGTVLVFGDTSTQRAREVAAAAEHDRDRADLASARRDVAELQWMADVTQALSASLDEREVMRRLGRLCAGRIGDVVIVDLIDEDGVIERVGHATAPGVDLDLDEIMARPEVATDFEPNSRTYQAGTSAAVVRFDRGDVLDENRLSPQTRALLTAVDANEVLAAPLVARNHVVGMFGLILTGSKRFEELDLLVARDLAQRAALAVDNARLFRAQTDVSTRLQQALLPVLPTGIQVRAAVRYLPAAAHFDVGGDWYDLFRCPYDSDTCVLVIGDVAGHDIAAGATMSALRNLLRGIAVATNDTPGGVLDAVDRNMAALGIAGTATTVVMTVTPQDDGTWSVLWSNAGHLPPLLLVPGGEVMMLDDLHGPLLGTRLPSRRGDGRLTVPGGSTIVLYTDGLVEDRSETIDTGLTRLRMSARATTVPLDDPEALAADLLARNRVSVEDDTAMLVCHLPVTQSSSASNATA